MSAFTGLPDFGRPERYGVVSAYAAYEQPGIVRALPTGLRPADDLPLVVELWQQTRGDDVVEFGLVTAAFAVDVPLDTTTRDPRSHVVARPAPLAEGWLRMTAPPELGVPPDLLLPQAFDALTGRSLPVVVRLDAVGAELLVGCLRAGLQALGAEAWIRVRGLATRCAGTLTVDADVLLAALGADPVTSADLADRVVDGLPGLTVVGGPADATLWAAAVAERVLARLGSAAAGLEAGVELTWDLSVPAAGVQVLRLTTDPVTGTSAADDVVRRHTAPPLTDGRERIFVYTTLPPDTGGVLLAGVRLTAPPAPPGRPFPAEATGQLTPPAPTQLTLALRAGEPLVYDLAGSAVLDSDTGPRVLNGPRRRVEGDSTPVLTPADLGLRLIPVDATADLLDRAEVEVRVAAELAGETYRAAVQLHRDRPRAWLAVPRSAVPAAVTAVATARTPDRTRVEQPLPDAAVWLDPFSFVDPPWSVPGPDPDPVVVEAGGLRVAGLPDEADWRFVPLTAGPVRDPAGAPQLSLIEAGGSAFLMVTTALQVSDAAQAEALAACRAAGAPDQVRLSPAPVEVQEVTLLVLRDGVLAPLTTATASGTATQDAAFSATLDAADLAACHRALEGETGTLLVRYALSVSAAGPVASLLAGPAGAVVVTTDASTWPQ